MGWPWYITVFVFDLAHAVAETTIINRSLFDRYSHVPENQLRPLPSPFISPPLHARCEDLPLYREVCLKISRPHGTPTCHYKHKSLCVLKLRRLSSPCASPRVFKKSEDLTSRQVYSPPILQMCFECRDQGFKHRISSCRVASKSPTCSLTKTASRTAATMSSTNPVKHQRKASELLPGSLRLLLRLRVPFFATLGLRIALRLLAFLCAGASY
ncbi:hypothetical protein R3P38DRAFT_3215158 [Favolaschia claudopus]|uniref:Secreted protein n=1 Tax=Favolaschia claudopus TaxID=2862362 RepID=A0AAV9ZFW0_9AGAR